MDLKIESWEKNILRDIAKKQFEYASLPVMKERTTHWYDHNDLKSRIPVIHFETWTCESDLLPELVCSSKAAREIELQLYRNIVNHEMINDDTVVKPCYSIGWKTKFTLFDLKIDTIHSLDESQNNLGHKFIHKITDIEKDISELKPSTMSADKDNTFKWKSFVEELIGDILDVKISTGSLSASLTQKVVHLMGMEKMLFALYDSPDIFKEFMKRISDDYIRYFKWLQESCMLSLNNENDPLSQGSFGFTRDLPGKDYSDKAPIQTSMLWGYMDSQETVSISPEMFHDFFFPYYKQVAECFGLLSYACCEPVHPFWKESISKFPGLRKVSISSWCDEEFMGNELRGKKIIYHRKPSPNYVGVGKNLDEEAFRNHIKKTLDFARGCHLEFSFRDVYTLNGNTDKPRRAVEIIRELVQEHWN